MVKKRASSKECLKANTGKGFSVFVLFCGQLTGRNLCLRRHKQVNQTGRGKFCAAAAGQGSELRAAAAGQGSRAGLYCAGAAGAVDAIQKAKKSGSADAKCTPTPESKSGFREGGGCVEPGGNPHPLHI